MPARAPLDRRRAGHHLNRKTAVFFKERHDMNREGTKRTYRKPVLRRLGLLRRLTRFTF
jgi:hypothetical protein